MSKKQKQKISSSPFWAWPSLRGFYLLYRRVSPGVWGSARRCAGPSPPRHPYSPMRASLSYSCSWIPPPSAPSSCQHLTPWTETLVTRDLLSLRGSNWNGEETEKKLTVYTCTVHILQRWARVPGFEFPHSRIPAFLAFYECGHAIFSRKAGTCKK